MAEKPRRAGTPGTAGTAGTPRPGAPRPGGRLSVDFAACDGHGLCAELLPELITLDEWGYPVLRATAVPSELAGDARRAVAACPVMALRFTRPPARHRHRAAGRSPAGGTRAERGTQSGAR
ncbi:ferredoxin [Streptomyces sp. PLAI1-29]|uniref:Ferredoxin n=2 Tax=Streptomyces zingiberis TaxID=2053010 RepID=A0ABX1BWY5_9ACTN|nr:ferredoxin [Streptomyces zingiberis]